MKKDNFDQGKKNKTERMSETENKAAEDVQNEVKDEISAENELAAENAKLHEDILRALAEAENIKKRCAQEIEKNNKYAVAGFAKDLLGVADNLQRALDAAAAAAGNDGLLQGVKLTADELAHVFAKHGIVPMKVVGEVFDPNFHRVVQEVDVENKPSGEIVAELQRGYLLNGRLLREAMVVVSKGQR